MDNQFVEAVETAFTQGKISALAKTVLLTGSIKHIAEQCAEEMIVSSGLSGSKLSVFLDWLFADPTRIMDLLLKILGIFTSKEKE